MRALGAEGVLAIEDIWSYCADPSHGRTDGDLSGMSDEDIADEIDWAGDAGELMGTLCGLALIDGGPGNRSVHDWLEHNPYAASFIQRSWSGKKAAHERWAKLGRCAGGTEFCDSRCGSMRPAVRTDASAMRINATRIENNASRNADRTDLDAPTPAPVPSPAPAPIHRSRHATRITQQVKSVFDYWARLHPSDFQTPHSGLREWREIARRITQDGKSVEDLCAAIDGLHSDDWEDRAVNLELYHAVKSASAVNRNQRILKHSKDPVLSTKTKKSVTAGQRWLERTKDED